MFESTCGDPFSGSKFEEKLIGGNNRPEKIPLLENPFDVFDFEDLLGQGGFGYVFKVRNKNTNCLYALKTITPKGENKVYYWLKNEINNIAKLSMYPDCKQQILCYYGTFKINYEFGETEEDFNIVATDKLTYCILTDFIEGKTIEELIDYYKVNFCSKLALIYSLMTAIKIVHDAGFAHRDIKPKNAILAAGDNGEKRVVLIDFGFSCSLGEDPKIECKKSDRDVGTLPYVAPELITETFNRENVGKAFQEADIYALGMTIYFILSDGDDIEFLTSNEDIRKGLQLSEAEISDRLIYLILRMTGRKGNYPSISQSIKEMTSIILSYKSKCESAKIF